MAKIPKRIFFYWANDKMSWLRYMSLSSFRKLNPDWEIVLYVSKQRIYKKSWNELNSQDFFTFQGKDYTKEIEKLNVKIIDWELNDPLANTMASSHKSNFLKWSELDLNGGIFSDLDILYLRPMDDLYEKIKDYDGLVCQNGWFSIGFLASKIGNDFFKDVYKQALRTYSPKNYQSAGVESVFNSLGCVESQALNSIQTKYKNLNFYNLPFHIIYPFINGDIHVSLKNIMRIGYNDDILNTLPKDTVGFHWYAGFPLSQELNNLLTGDNYKEYKNIITDLIEKFNLI